MKPYTLVVENKSIDEIIKFSENFCEIDEFLWATSKISCGIYKQRKFTVNSSYNVPLKSAKEFFESCFADGYTDVRLDIISGDGFEYVASIIFTKIKNT